MKNNNLKENIELILDEADKPIDKAKFIISNIYYCIRNFYHDKYIESTFEEYQNYLTSFQNKFHKKAITNTFSFNLLNKSSSVDNSIDNISNINNVDTSNEEKTKEEIYYDLLYNKLINIIDEEKYYNQEDFIESYISLRNCFIFLEYLYLLLKKNPNLINHYIIKIDISLLLDIPQRISKRLINSNEFFYLNLIELKGLFPEIKYSTSSFIDNLDEVLEVKYLDDINPLKSEKLITLKSVLSKLLESLGKINNNEISLLYDYLEIKLNNLTKDLRAPDRNNDTLIKQYILNDKNCKKKRLSQIVNEINYENNIIPDFNYLYLIALNKFNEIKETKDDDKITNDENEINENILNKNEKNANVSNISNINILNEKEKLISTNEKDKHIIKKNINISEKEKINDILKQKKENLIKREDLILEIMPIEGNTLGLKLEEINNYEDKYEEFIQRNFTYSRVLNLMNDNIYNILIFHEINKQKERKKIVNIDDIYIEYKNKFISLIEDINSIDYKLFYDIISDKNFHDEIITILKSEPIKEYLTKNRDYDEIKYDDINKNKKIYNFKFAKKGEPYVENFTQEYNKLMEKLNDSLFFINLFRLKYLPFGVKAFVNYNLKIIINSLYYKFNENIDKNNKIIILKAALKIIIIHEIMHILKYLKNEASFNEMPKTPRNREAGKMLINYLFGIPTIKSINLEEAKKINDTKNWNDTSILKKIFHDDNEVIEDESIIKNVDYLDLYFTEDDIEDESIKKIKIYEDIGIDID